MSEQSWRIVEIQKYPEPNEVKFNFGQPMKDYQACKEAVKHSSEVGE